MYGTYADITVYVKHYYLMIQSLSIQMEAQAVVRKDQHTEKQTVIWKHKLSSSFLEKFGEMSLLNKGKCHKILVLLFFLHRTPPTDSQPKIFCKWRRQVTENTAES
jgi:hypothetical protein